MKRSPYMYRLPDIDTPIGRFAGQPWVASDGAGRYGRGNTPTCALRDLIRVDRWLNSPGIYTTT